MLVMDVKDEKDSKSETCLREMCQEMVVPFIYSHVIWRNWHQL